MSPNARRFEQVYRIHAWITIGFLVLIVGRFVVLARFVDPGDDTLIAMMMALVVCGFLLWLHLHPMFRRSLYSRGLTVIVDAGVGAFILYGAFAWVSDRGWAMTLKHDLWALLFAVGLGLWFFSSAVMTGVYIWYDPPRNGGKRSGDC